MASKDIDYRRALGKPEELCAGNWLTELELEFEKVSEELEMDITLIFPVAERNSRARFGLHVDVNRHPGSTTTSLGSSSKAWRRLPPSPGPPPNRPLPPLPTEAVPRPVSVQSTGSSTTLRSRSNTVSTTEEALVSPVNTKARLRDLFRLGRRSAIVQSS